MTQGGIEASLLKELEQRGANASCKTAFVLAMLPVLFAEGHRTLIFSQSVVMLNILQVRSLHRPLHELHKQMG